MAYYECSKCGTKDEIFGKGYTKMMMDQFGIEVTNYLNLELDKASSDIISFQVFRPGCSIGICTPRRTQFKKTLHLNLPKRSKVTRETCE